MKDKVITVNPKTSEVFFDNGVLGIDGENLQGDLVFQFVDTFINGIGRLEIEIGDTKSYAMLTKTYETYKLPIKSFLTKQGKVTLQLVIDEPSVDESTPIFKSNIFYLIVKSSINAEIEQPEELPTWIEMADQKLLEIDDAIDEANTLDIDAEKVATTTTITITKKDGTTKEIEIEDGVDGQDAKINGVNTLTLEAGDNITLNQEGSTLTISSEAGNIDYEELENLPKINNVELKGNKTTSDLGIVIPDVSNFITKDVNNLTYYTKTSDLSNVATSGNYNDLTNKPDLSQYITKSVNDLINYYKKSETYTQAEINALIGAISTLNLLVVQTLPTEDISATTIYLVPRSTSETNNIYDEYIYVSNAWEKIGSTDIDLSNYYTKTQVDDLLDNVSIAVDGSTITKNLSDEIQAVGVKDTNTTNTDKFWSGTLSQYNAIQNKDANTFYYITDDYVNNAVPSGGTTGQVLSKASNTDYATQWVSQHNYTHETWTFTLEDDTTVDKEVVLW